MTATSPISLQAFPFRPDLCPTTRHTSGPYELAWAFSDNELHALQRLRYDVFNIELNEGLETSHASRRDEDAFDPWCHHLYIRHVPSGEMVGTYRMQTAEMAQAAIGWYSEAEFDLSSVPTAILSGSVETGRACIHRGHRSLKVLYLLWKGLGLYLSHTRSRYLFGCCSLTSQSDEEGQAVYAYLRDQGHLHPSVHVRPLPSHACRPVQVPPDMDGRPPRLMRAYLGFGARICGPPAIDREFKTIDYLALFDADTLRASELAFFTIGS